MNGTRDASPAVMLDYTEDIFRREHHIKRSLLAFAVAVVFAAVNWLAFTTYL